MGSCYSIWLNAIMLVLLSGCGSAPEPNQILQINKRFSEYESRYTEYLIAKDRLAILHDSLRKELTNRISPKGREALVADSASLLLLQSIEQEYLTHQQLYAAFLQAYDGSLTSARIWVEGLPTSTAPPEAVNSTWATYVHRFAADSVNEAGIRMAARQWAENYAAQIHRLEVRFNYGNAD